MAIAEGKKLKKFEKQLKAVSDHARNTVGSQTQIVTKVIPKYDSVKELEKTHGRSAIVRAQKQKEEEYKKRRNAGVKEIIKTYKKTKKSKG